MYGCGIGIWYACMYVRASAAGSLQKSSVVDPKKGMLESCVYDITG